MRMLFTSEKPRKILGLVRRLDAINEAVEFVHLHPSLDRIEGELIDIGSSIQLKPAGEDRNSQQQRWR